MTEKTPWIKKYWQIYWPDWWRLWFQTVYFPEDEDSPEEMVFSFGPYMAKYFRYRKNLVL